MWYPSHYWAILPGYAVIIGIALLSRRMSPRARTRALHGVMLALFLGELIKQLTVMGNYNANYLPFHYSSTYYISFGLYAFGRGRVKHYGMCTGYIGGVLLLTTMTFNPFSVVGDPAVMFHSFYQAYSYFFHMAVLLLWAIMLANGDYRVRRFDFLRYASFLLLWASSAIPAAYHFNMNYAGLLRSFIHPLELFRQRFGDVPYLLLYTVFILCVAALLLLLHRLFTQLRSRRTEEAAKN